MNIKLNASAALIAAAKEIAPITGVIPSDDGITVNTSEQSLHGLSLTKTDEGISLCYGSTADFCRAMGLLGEFVASDAKELTQHADFETLGYMPDCSRNAVPSVEGAKELMRNMAAMGFNAIMLYTEDTYEIPSQPYFGHMRGRYTVAELKELDAFALSLGIELIPCIQVLAHLNCIFRWNVYKNINDMDNILNIAKPETYQLIDEMLKVCAECFTSRRINLGMDEAHNLGRGRYYDTTGEHVKVTELMRIHLNNIVPMVQKYGFTPMMWSDMFFRPQYGGYYTTEGKLNDESVAAKPDSVIPIYWDYYCGAETVDNMMKCHEQFGGEYAFAGGAWKWLGFAPNNAYSLMLSVGHLNMCKKHKVKTVFTTGWGDKGGEAGQLSILPALLQYAEFCYNENVTNEDLDARSKALFDLSLDEFLTLDYPNMASYNTIDAPGITTQCKYLLFNDPLNGLMDKHVAKDDPETYAAHTKAIAAQAGNERYGYLFDTLAKLCHVLELKSTLTIDTREAYKAGDMDALRAIADKRIPEILTRLDAFIAAFRYQWYKENKTMGFDAQEQHLGGLKERLRSTALRLNDYASGRLERIEELEQPVLDFYCYDADREWMHIDAFEWQTIVSATPMH